MNPRRFGGDSFYLFLIKNDVLGKVKHILAISLHALVLFLKCTRGQERCVKTELHIVPDPVCNKCHGLLSFSSIFSLNFIIFLRRK